MQEIPKFDKSSSQETRKMLTHLRLRKHNFFLFCFSNYALRLRVSLRKRIPKRSPESKRLNVRPTKFIRNPKTSSVTFCYIISITINLWVSNDVTLGSRVYMSRVNDGYILFILSIFALSYNIRGGNLHNMR